MFNDFPRRSLSGSETTGSFSESSSEIGSEMYGISPPLISIVISPKLELRFSISLCVYDIMILYKAPKFTALYSICITKAMINSSDFLPSSTLQSHGLSSEQDSLVKRSRYRLLQLLQYQEACNLNARFTSDTLVLFIRSWFIIANLEKFDFKRRFLGAPRSYSLTYEFLCVQTTDFYDVEARVPALIPSRSFIVWRKPLYFLNNFNLQTGEFQKWINSACSACITCQYLISVL